MYINEIYLSINGEGFSTTGRSPMIGTGVPTILVRTHGCHIRCDYCDTAFTWDGSERGTAYTTDKLLAEIERVSRGFGSVLLTGGEPGIQEDVTASCRAIKAAGYSLCIETAGGCDIRVFGTDPPPDAVILDVKCPSAGTRAMNASWVEGNMARLRPVDQIKFVIADRQDWDFMLSVLDDYGLARRGPAATDEPVIIVSPLDGRGSQAARVVQWILNSSRPILLGLQTHKFIWPVDRRKV